MSGAAEELSFQPLVSKECWGFGLLPRAFTIVSRHVAKSSKTPGDDNHRVQNNKYISASHQCQVGPTTLTAVT
jgi:hypothetical protein